MPGEFSFAYIHQKMNECDGHAQNENLTEQERKIWREKYQKWEIVGLTKYNDLLHEFSREPLEIPEEKRRFWKQASALE